MALEDDEEVVLAEEDEQVHDELVEDDGLSYDEVVEEVVEKM